MSAWTIQFIKHVLPKLMSPLSPATENQKRVDGDSDCFNRFK